MAGDGKEETPQKSVVEEITEIIGDEEEFHEQSQEAVKELERWEKSCEKKTEVDPQNRTPNVAKIVKQGSDGSLPPLSGLPGVPRIQKKKKAEMGPPLSGIFPIQTGLVPQSNDWDEENENNQGEKSRSDQRSGAIPRRTARQRLGPRGPSPCKGVPAGYAEERRREEEEERRLRNSGRRKRGANPFNPRRHLNPDDFELVSPGMSSSWETANTGYHAVTRAAQSSTLPSSFVPNKRSAFDIPREQRLGIQEPAIKKSLVEWKEVISKPMGNKKRWKGVKNWMFPGDNHWVTNRQSKGDRIRRMKADLMDQD